MRNRHTGNLAPGDGTRTYPWFVAVTTVLAVILSLSVGEIVFRSFFPPPMVVGSVKSNPNKERYGWGLGPHVPLPAVDPDSGRTIIHERTNSRGWKDVEHSFESSPGKSRIIVIGDSITQGVPPIPATYHRRLEGYLNDRGCNVEVIALGYGGWATDQQYVAYLEEGRLYSPDIVVSQFCDNDLLGLVGKDPYFDTSLKPFRVRMEGSEVLLEKRMPSKPHRPWANWLSVHSRLFMVTSDFLRSIDGKGDGTGGWPQATQVKPLTAGLRSPGELDASTSQQLNLYAALVCKWKSQCTDAGSLFFVFNPSSEEGELSFALENGLIRRGENGGFIQQITTGEWLRIDFQRPRRLVEEALGACGVEVISLARKYERYQLDSHPNEAGNVAMAADIGDFLLSHPIASTVLGGEASDAPHTPATKALPQSSGSKN